MSLIHRTPTSAGIGLRLPHIEEAVATQPSVGWLEIHPENFLVNPHASELLVALANHYPVSVHTVGPSVGSATGLDRRHLARVRALVDRVDPVLVSGHLAWSTHGAEYLNGGAVLERARRSHRVPAAVRRQQRLFERAQHGLRRARLP